MGTDGSETAKQALRHAMDLAAVNGGTVHIVSAYRSSGGAVKVGTEAEHWYVDTRTKIDTILDSAAAMARSKGVTVETHAVETDRATPSSPSPARSAPTPSSSATRGCAGAKRFLLGSVPNKVAHNAPCTVVIVKTT